MVLLLYKLNLELEFRSLSFFSLSLYLILLASQVLHLLVCGKDYTHKPIRGLEVLSFYMLEN